MSFENQIKEILKARLEGTATEEVGRGDDVTVHQ